MPADGLEPRRPERARARSRRPPRRPIRPARSRPAASTPAPARAPRLGHLTSPMMRSAGCRALVADDEGFRHTAPSRRPGRGRRDGAAPPARRRPPRRRRDRRAAGRRRRGRSASPTRDRPAPSAWLARPIAPARIAVTAPARVRPHGGHRRSGRQQRRVVDHARVAALTLDHAPEDVERRPRADGRGHGLERAGLVGLLARQHHHARGQARHQATRGPAVRRRAAGPGIRESRARCPRCGRAARPCR